MSVLGTPLSQQPLAGLVVVELATGVAGPYAGKLFADFGAEVVKVEPPTGDPARLEGAREGDRPAPERSPLFAHLNLNKRGVTADPSTPEGRHFIESLLASADVVIESSLSTADEHWLDADQLRRRFPHLVVTSVTPFGRTGPYAGRAGSDLVAYAMGGPLNATGAPEREPTKLAGRVVEYQAGAIAAVASLGAVLMAATSGEGTHVDVANFETQAGSIDRRLALLMGYIFTRRLGSREGGNRVGIIPAGIYPNADGYCQIVFAPNWMDRVAKMLDHDELTDKLSSPGWMDDLSIPEVMAEAVLTWTIQRTKAEAMEEAQSRGLAVMPLNDTTDVLDDPHFRARDYWREVEHPVLGTYETPGPQVRMDNGWQLRRPAPLLGQHNDEIRAEFPRARTPPPATADASALPLDGIRVLDMTVVWAGPLCTALLGDLGAEVIRVDNPNLFPTATRGAIPRPRPGHEADLGQYWGSFPDGEAGERPWNRVQAFVIHSRGKKGATLDLRTELGRETFLRLVEQTDVFVENNSAKVLDQLGLGWDVLSARNPRLIAVRMPSLGLAGPYANHVGFGAQLEAMCGLTALRGYRDLDPSVLDATYFMDPASGAIATFATMAALRRRDETGHGELIEVPQAENLLNYIGEYLVDSSLTGEPHERHGNRHPHRAPQGVFPCEGHDRWVAISVATDDQWSALVELMGRPTWATEPELATESGRRAAHDQLDQHLAEFTSTHDRDSLSASLLTAGVEAAPVLDEADLLDDPQLAARGFFRPNGSRDVPETIMPGHLWRWDGPPLGWGPLSVMGADNEEVFRHIVGLSDDEMAALRAERHLSEYYHGPDGQRL